MATVVACVFAAFCEGFDLQAAGVAAAGIAAQFKPTPEQLGTFFSASSLGLFVGALLGGRLSDSIGRKATLIISISLFGIFSIATPLATDIQFLSWARLLTGAGLGGAFPNLLALVNETSPPTRRQANVALVYAGMPFGGAIASLFSMVIEPGAWRWIFLAGGIVPLLLAPTMIWVVRESAVFSERSGTRADTSMPRAGSFVAIFAGQRALATTLLWVSSFLALLTLYLLLSWLPTLLVGNGFSKPEAAGAQIAFNLGGGLAVLLLGQLLERDSRNLSIITVFVAMPVTLLLLSRAPHDLPLVVAIVFALGAAVVAAQGYLYTAVPGVYPHSIRGVGVGAMVAVGRAGSIVGPKLGGALKGAGHGSAQLLLDILPVVVLCSAVALVFALLRDAPSPR
jgi:MFS transporter, AAHS family, 3-hydroxyphenylpropionic acid transporter